MKRFLMILVFLTLVIANLFLINYFIIKETKPIKESLNKIDLKNVDNLMIIAHPDDESLWGGAHLAKKDYLVVCVTCGSVKERKEEFEKAMSEFGNKYISLGYPDKTNNEKDNWATVYYKIEKDLIDIINYKNWKTIVTHNPDGEYDHIHHRMISTMVSKNTQKDKLYYFNKYYTKEELEDINYCMNELNDKELYAKTILLNDYPSQERSIKYDHVQNIIYEKFIPYIYWN